MLQRYRRLYASALPLLVCAVTLLAGCGSPTVIDGRAASMMYDPNRVAGLPVSTGPTGMRSNAPAPTGAVDGTDHGDNDRLALLAANDIEEFWTQNWAATFPGVFTPVAGLQSYDSTVPDASEACGEDFYGAPNAMYCFHDDVMAWDRGSLIPGARQFYTDISVAGILAHEFGHAVQWRTDLVDEPTRSIVREQQADCFAGVYLRWVAEGHSPRFTLNTTDGLDHVLAGGLWLRDDPEGLGSGDEHGSALDRIGAFQEGFDGGAQVCAGIDRAEIARRREGLPKALQFDPSSDIPGEMPVDTDSLATLMELLGQLFHPSQPPTLTVGDNAGCPDAKPSPPASYCPATNTINVDLPALQQLGTYQDEKRDSSPLRGDNTAYSVATSRYMLALQHERGLPLDTETAALRTACLTGVAQRLMSEQVSLPSGKSMVLTAGDLDEAVAGLLLNRLAAGDVNGATVPAGFTRVFAFRSGLTGDAEQCYQRFP